MSLFAPVRGQFVSVQTAESHGYGCYCHEEIHGDTQVEAVTALITESDSFGSEYFPMCQECKDTYILERDKARKEEDENPTGFCDWCKASNVRVYPQRDWEEGSHGPVYDVCSPCSRKYQENLAKENAQYEEEDDYDDYYPCSHDENPSQEELDQMEEEEEFERELAHREHMEEIMWAKRTPLRKLKVAVKCNDWEIPDYERQKRAIYLLTLRGVKTDKALKTFKRKDEKRIWNSMIDDMDKNKIKHKLVKIK